MACPPPSHDRATDPCGDDVGCTVAILEGSCSLLGHAAANRCYAKDRSSGKWTGCDEALSDLVGGSDGSQGGDAAAAEVLGVSFGDVQPVDFAYVTKCATRDSELPQEYQFASWGMHDSTAQIHHTACADPVRPGWWGGPAGGITWMPVDLSLPGCAESLAASGVEARAVAGLTGLHIPFSGLQLHTIATGSLENVRAAIEAKPDTPDTHDTGPTHTDPPDPG
jgi:hypothetical protein